MTNTKTIARNTGWSSLENIINGIVNLATSIAIARSLGPSKNGYIVYISFIAGLVCNLGGLGISATARKYMAEFLALGDRGTARYIYWRTLLLQAILASIGTGSILFWIYRSAPTEYKLASILIALSIWPSMVNSISAQANVASEDFSSNVPASILQALTYFFGIAATIVFKWGVVGIGSALLAGRSVDFVVRLFPAVTRAFAWETTHIHPPGLRRRMISFAWQSLLTMGVSLVVWNRSEVVLLGKFCADIRQVAFYSVAFSMADQLLQGATIFGSAAGATIFAQYGRDKSKIADLASTTFRYLALTSIPLHFIAAALAVPALLFIYGHEYSGAAMVVTLAPLLCLPKAFVAPVQNLLESFEKQRYVIAATAVASVIDISVAWYLIRSHGAVGACIGSGAAQIVAVLMMWTFGIYHQKVKLPWVMLAKVAFISILAALTAHFFVVRMAPLAAILVGGSASVILLFTLFYYMRVLEPEDYRRFKLLSGILPRPFFDFTSRFLAILIRSQETGTAPCDIYSYQYREEVHGTDAKKNSVILLIAYYFPPDNEIGAARPYRFYKYLSKLGYECHVITAAPQKSVDANIEYIEDSLRSGVHGGIAYQLERIIRKLFYGYGLKIQWSILAFLAGRSFVKARRCENIVVISTSPPVSTHIAAILLSFTSKRKWIADFRDPIHFDPGNPGFVQRFIAAGLSRVVLKRSDLALANTDKMRQLWIERFSELGGKTHILWNGFDPDDAITTYVLPQRQRKILSHVGELYGGRDIRPILRAMVGLFDSSRLAKDSILVRQVGAVSQPEMPDQRFLTAAKTSGWLEFNEPVIASEARSVALDSDGLLLIQPQSDVQVPGKLFEYLRLGRPILAFVIRHSPTERILQRSGVPFECVFPEDTPDEVEQRILRFLEMLDRHPAECSSWFAETFDASRQALILDALIRSLEG